MYAVELFLTLFSFCYFPRQMTKLIRWGIRSFFENFHQLAALFSSFESVWEYEDDDDNNNDNPGAFGLFVMRLRG